MAEPNSLQTGRKIFFWFSGIASVLPVLVFMASSWHWPLLGDASLMHYICFLMDHGLAPYRDVRDMNMPGCFLLEWAVMHGIGGGDLAWRIYDFLLMGIAAAAILAIARPYGWFSGVYASSLFILAHGQDGLSQTGQRDLAMAVALLVATAFLFLAIRENKLWPAALFGFFAGFAPTIKPTSLAFIAGILILALLSKQVPQKRRLAILGTSIATLIIGPAIAFLFLWEKGLLSDFFLALRTVVPYYTNLGHRPFDFLLIHSISPFLSLAILWLIILAIARPPLTWERQVLFMGVGFGLISYLVQARGFPYHRYPLLAFLLPLISIDLTDSLQPFTPRIRQTLAVLGVIVGAFFLAPISAYKIMHYDWRSLEFNTSLEGNLARLGGPALSGRIQCIDSISGCETSLYRMKLLQSTPLVWDFLLFGPRDKPIIRQTQETFLHSIQQQPPTVMVVSSFLHIDGPDGYNKLRQWPEFQSYLSRNYCEAVDWTPPHPERWWSRPQWPNGYRIYLLRSHTGTSRCDLIS